VLLKEGAEIVDGLVGVWSEILYYGHSGAGPVGAGILAAVGRGYQEMMVRDLDVVVYLVPRDAGRYEADRGRVGVVELEILKHASSLPRQLG
jgi:hypothetical protein